MTRDFPLGDILSITTGRLVAESGVGAIYGILNYMTGDELYTHQLPRAFDECLPHLFRQHPQLDPDLSALMADQIKLLVAGLEQSPDGPKAVISPWLAGMVAMYGESLPVEPIPDHDHARIDPVIEAEMMIDGKVIIVNASDLELS